MQYTTLENTNLQVSKIALGTMTFGEQNTEKDGHQQLDYALERGVNFIDTAEMYAVPTRAETQGSTERIIGTWLKHRPDREKIVLATKIAGPNRGITYLRNPLNFKELSIRNALDDSRQRLQTDYVDLYQLHWPERLTNYFGQRGYQHRPDDAWEDNFLQVLETMTALIEEGKIRYFGISNETAWGTMRWLQLADSNGLARPVSIQNPFSLLNRTFEIGLAEVAMRAKIGLLAYSPLAFGWLSGKYHRQTDAVGRVRLFPKLARYNSEQAQAATASYLDIAAKFGFRPAQMALAFVNQQPFVVSTIIGATTMPQLIENIDSISLRLPHEALRAIEAVHQKIPNPAP